MNSLRDINYVCVKTKIIVPKSYSLCVLWLARNGSPFLCFRWRNSANESRRGEAWVCVFVQNSAKNGSKWGNLAKETSTRRTKVNRTEQIKRYLIDASILNCSFHLPKRKPSKPWKKNVKMPFTTSLHFGRCVCVLRCHILWVYVRLFCIWNVSNESFHCSRIIIIISSSSERAKERSLCAYVSSIQWNCYIRINFKLKNIYVPSSFSCYSFLCISRFLFLLCVEEYLLFSL